LKWKPLGQLKEPEFDPGPLQVIIIILFGVGRIGKIAGELGSGIRSFKDALIVDEEEEKDIEKRWHNCQ